MNKSSIPSIPVISITDVFEARLWIKDYLLRASKQRELDLEEVLIEALMYLPICKQENAQKLLSSRNFPSA
jgi:hypothetical protein